MPVTVRAAVQVAVLVRLSNDKHAQQVFNSYQRVAHSIAAKMALKFNWSRTELLDEALSRLGELAMEARDTHDRTRASLCTWLYSEMYWHLYNHCAVSKQKAKKHQTTFTPSEEPAAPRGRLLERLLGELSEEARALVQIVVEVPGELHTAFRFAASDATSARAALLRYLQDAGVDDDTIDSAWTEVQEALALETLAAD